MEKEPTYFAKEFPGYRMMTEESEYLDLYAGAGNVPAVGDCSVWYLYNDEAVPNILAFDPQARFIICVRDPVNMAHSPHAHMLQAYNNYMRARSGGWMENS